MIRRPHPKVKKKGRWRMGEVEDFYAAYDEDTRLTRDNVHRVEWIATTAVLAEHIGPGARIIDVGAGTGAYTLHFARRGYGVTAVDLVDHHVRRLAERAAGEGLSNVACAQADARDLSAFAEASFDVVLCMGPLYHLGDEADRSRCIEECLRVLAPGGLLALAYVSKNAALRVGEVRIQPLRYNYDCFVMDDPGTIVPFLKRFPVTVIDHASVDGMSRGMLDVVNGMNPEEFEAWTRFTLSICRGPTAFRQAYHGLVLCRKVERETP
jgi:2-polyprenyl-3-methyl-5-hydroxy-6-metoxy-1,4-benzoquinol methylase